MEYQRVFGLTVEEAAIESKIKVSPACKGNLTKEDVQQCASSFVFAEEGV